MLTRTCKPLLCRLGLHHFCVELRRTPVYVRGWFCTQERYRYARYLVQCCRCSTQSTRERFI
jgi:hypothetical protein